MSKPILEIALLDVIPGEESEFEQSFARAQEIIASMTGYLGHELQRCIETPNRYALLVRWQTLEDHTEGFRNSPQYKEWKELLHRFYDPFPVVEHHRPIYEGS